MNDEIEEEEDHGTNYFLEVRTNFILKCNYPGAKVVLGAETFGSRLTLDDYGSIISDEELVDIRVRDRLSQYCMPNDYIRAFAQNTLEFARLLACDPRYSSSTIRVRVVLDVCTVQLEGEPIYVTIDRLVKPDSLIPLELRDSSLEQYFVRLPILIVRDDDDDDDEKGIESCPICLRRSTFFAAKMGSVEKHSFHQKHCVRREDALTLMEACPICFREPVVGAKIVFLACEQEHAFHDRCLARWLLESKSCPVCRVDIVMQSSY